MNQTKALEEAVEMIKKYKNYITCEVEMNKADDILHALTEDKQMYTFHNIPVRTSFNEFHQLTKELEETMDLFKEMGFDVQIEDRSCGNYSSLPVWIKANRGEENWFTIGFQRQIGSYDLIRTFVTVNEKQYEDSWIYNFGVNLTYKKEDSYIRFQLFRNYLKSLRTLLLFQ
jgi:hypothetical protein